MRSLFVSAILTLTGCAVTPEAFQEDFPPAFCTYAVPCAEAAPPGETDTGALSESQCEVEFTDYVATVSGDEGCTFNADAAQACLDAIAAAASCSAAETVRDACEGVYTGDACDLHLSALL